MRTLLRVYFTPAPKRKVRAPSPTLHPSQGQGTHPPPPLKGQGASEPTLRRLPR
ncbi:hypothetical protein T484DRAFT_1940032, partial [Baffinella frigidus]